MIRRKIKQIIKKYMNSSLKSKLNIFMSVILIPMFLLGILLIYNTWKAGDQYESSIQNVTKASEFSFAFKETVDAKMYKIVAGSKTFEVEDPYKDVEEARRVIRSLQDTTEVVDNRMLLQRIDNTLKNLSLQMQEIEKDYRQISYEDNMERLETSIYDITDIVNDGVAEYIYDEASYLNTIKEEVSRNIDLAIGLSIAASLIVIILAVGFSSVITSSITKPIESLCSYAKKVGKGDFSVRAEEGGDEIQELSYSLNQMVKRIGNLVEDVKIEQFNLRKTELELLQSQINPHFLYNTFDTIIWLVEDHQNDAAIEMVKSLSTFFRTSLSKGQDFITIEAEISHVRSYLEIQQFRYQDILEYEIHIPEELIGYRILKLTLQPLVENSLYHGIKTRRGMGKITITGKYEEDSLLLIVEDNGSGMSEETLKKVRKNIGNRKERDEGTSFGLFNVNERIRLNYGGDYGLTVESEEGRGTRVTVKIPPSN